MNRGSEALRNRARIAREPSMRPRFMNRGSAEARRPRTMEATAFNEAPIHESGKSRPRGEAS